MVRVLIKASFGEPIDDDPTHDDITHDDSVAPTACGQIRNWGSLRAEAEPGFFLCLCASVATWKSRAH